ncbi:hypothetical protein AXF42_Ash004873 [Apostasia shenzhenica]|uniref:SURP motif domain-containing protein n=1 Tax=Apostasia shenzhenica TaxID=1088818 RepID=A0A2I0B7T6_9ASPA|nr:hypothetical protein AXF42_Ash004873 [Apostasia shenzhenica]
MESDEEDFVFYGTPIEREEDTSARKRKAIVEAGSFRNMPSWKQEVRDEEGRRRFHGAFTGGFSAGYYNSVGSKEGWTPQAFTSSRKNRSEMKNQSIYSFLDDEDIKDMGGKVLDTSLKFDTFGFTAVDLARKQAEKEQKNRPSAIPGPVPDELILPASSSIGIKLLLKMGWRQGHSLKETKANSLYDARREARKALLAFSGNLREQSHIEAGQYNSGEYPEMEADSVFSSQNTPILLGIKGTKILLPSPTSSRAVGVHAVSTAARGHFCRLAKQGEGSWLAPTQGGRIGLSLMSLTQARSLCGSLACVHLGRHHRKYAPGFGIGALEELDIEDEDIYSSGIEIVGTVVQEDEPSRSITTDGPRLENTKQGVLRGFRVASNSDYNLERFPPPVIPLDFKPHYQFASPLDTLDKFLEPPPPEVPPPEDESLKILIDGFANLVGRCGKIFEDLSREKNKSNPLFSFLSGGSGHNYYSWKLWEAKRRHSDQQKPSDVLSHPSDRSMTADTRGRILGERPLERSYNDSVKSDTLKDAVHFQTNLSDTFTKPAVLVGSSECAKPFQYDLAKQERFEQFLKEKYQGGLRSLTSGGADKMSEAARARERLDFEAAAESISKGEMKPTDSLHSDQNSIQPSNAGDWRFVSSAGGPSSQDEEKLSGILVPKREEFQWRPSPLLCKRFDIIDPYMGKNITCLSVICGYYAAHHSDFLTQMASLHLQPPPLQRPRSKMDTLMFINDSIIDAKSERLATESRESSLNVANMDLPLIAHSETPSSEQTTAEQLDTNLRASLQRPVDLYKAIFSDDSDEEDDSKIAAVEPKKRSEGANKTLNRLVAGDFLESLGKELGLEVPEDPRPHVQFDNAVSSSLAKAIGGQKDTNLSSSNNKASAAPDNFNAVMGIKEAQIHEPKPSGIVEKSVHSKKKSAKGDGISGRVENDLEKKEATRKHYSSSRRQRNSSGTDSSGEPYHSHSKSEKASLKRRDKKQERYHESKRRRSRGRYSSDASESELSDDAERSRKSKHRRHSGRSKSKNR